MNSFTWVWALLFWCASTSAAAESYSIGVAKEEITSLDMGRVMLGYGQESQRTLGVDLPLYARAFVVQKNEDSLAIVVVDLAMSFGFLKEEIVARVARDLPGVYGLDNLLVQATHTHSAPGAYAMHDFYNLTTGGFRRAHFEAIAERIARAIVRAHQGVVPGQLRFAEGRLEGASINRSLVAHLRNTESSTETAHTDQRMRQLVFVTERGVPIGLLNWFAVHTTSMSKWNRAISGDNKGYAAHFVESSQAPGFVAGFANGAEGDASPDVFVALGLPVPQSDVEKTQYIGRLQAKRALELVNVAVPLPLFRLRAVHSWATMPGLRVEDAQGKQQTLCQPAVGESFAAGAEDGPSDVPGFWEGIRKDDFRWHQLWIVPALQFLRPLLGGDGGDSDCQGQKSILISSPKNGRLLPEQLAFQLMQIGPLVIAAVPGEPTTTAGLRIEKRLLREMRTQGVQHVLVGGLSNDYGGYITTAEEYDAQQYEGGHTLYGPHTLLGFQKIFSELVDHIGDDEKSTTMPVYRTFTPMQDRLVVPPIDQKREEEKPGEVLRQPKAEVNPGEYVWAIFRSARPNRISPTTSDIYWLEERRNGTWMRADDVRIEMSWSIEQSTGCPGCNRLMLRWSPKSVHQEKDYRFVHRGIWLEARSAEGQTYLSRSRPFRVRP